LKTALITGAGKGIGRAIAIALLKSGYRCLVVSRTAADLETLQPYGAVLPFVADLNDAEARASLAAYVLNENLVPEVLVNNAGFYLPDTVSSLPSALDQNLNSNLIQVRELTALLWESLLERKNAYVFNIVSVLGKQIRPEAASYTIAKHGLAAYNRLLFKEGKKQNVKVTGIFPASVYTAAWEGSGVNPDWLIKPEDIAQLVITCLNLSAAAVPDEIHLQCMQEGF